MTCLSTNQSSKTPNSSLCQFYFLFMWSGFITSQIVWWKKIWESPGQKTCPKASLSYTNSSLIKTGHGGPEISFFFCSILSFTWRLDTVLISLPVLTQLISCDYFATRLDISRHFDVLSFVYFKCNLFCTIASYVWYFSADSLRQMSATQLEQFAEWQVYFSNPRLCLLPVTLLI